MPLFPFLGKYFDADKCKTNLSFLIDLELLRAGCVKFHRKKHADDFEVMAVTLPLQILSSQAVVGECLRERFLQIESFFIGAIFVIIYIIILVNIDCQKSHHTKWFWFLLHTPPPRSPVSIKLPVSIWLFKYTTPQDYYIFSGYQ